MNPQEVIQIATQRLQKCVGHPFQQLKIEKPTSVFEALNLLKITSKLSPIIGNLFEIDAVEILTGVKELNGLGKWVRQDPDFPDVLFQTGEAVEPGFEVKAWYPFSTEITGRFKDSQNRFAEDQTYVLMFAWLPEELLYGKPKMIDLCLCSAKSISAARDTAYHNPPDYLVIEPGDTSKRTKNLQQTNTSGYKFQGTPAEFAQAQKVVEAWGIGGAAYQPTAEYQEHVRELMEKFKYRLDTNYAKMDRVFHDGIETFKTKVLNTVVRGKRLGDWSKFFNSAADGVVAVKLQQEFGIEPKANPQTLFSTSEESPAQNG